MNWLSQSEIKRRAEISDEEALNVSIEHWEQMCEAIKMGHGLGSYYDEYNCGLCRRHLRFFEGKGCEYCPLSEKTPTTESCCQEWRNFRDDRTLSNAQAMLNRLYQEKGKMLCKKEPKKEPCKKEREIRHGDYGHYKDDELWWAWQRDETLELFGEDSGCGCAIVQGSSNMVKDGNCIDDLKRNAEDLRECRHKGQDNNKFLAQIMPGDRIYIHADAAYFSIEQTQEIGQKLLQVCATTKRDQAKKKDDC